MRGSPKKCSHDQIRQIVWQAEHHDVPISSLARDYGVSRRTIHRYLAEARAMAK